MTAVEWLLEQYENNFPLTFDAINKAKELEKEQIIRAFNNGVYDGGCIIKKYKMSGRKYYNKTFK